MSGSSSKKSSKVIPPHPYRASHQFVGVKRPDRLRAGTLALREIRRAQKSTGLLIPKTNFSRLVREIGGDLQSCTRWTANALEALQESAEDYVVTLMQDANLSSIHRGAITVTPSDVRHVLTLRKDSVTPQDVDRMLKLHQRA
jgi:histone H3/H4